MIGIHLNYKELRNISPKAARQVVIQILKANKRNISKTAKILKITRKTVYKTIKKEKTGNLDDLSHKAYHIANKTPKDIEEKTVETKNKTNYGPKRIKEELFLRYKINLSSHTIRNILRRNKEKIKGKRIKRIKKSPRVFVDWYSAKSFEVVQIDLKYIVDQKALSQAHISHIFSFNLPIYQWSALDVFSRFKLIAYSQEKSWTNGLTWFLWVTSWIRSHGIKNKIIYTVDHGTEFGGDCWWKISELKKLLSGFNCYLIQNHKKSPQENAHLERSHRTDDEEFYIPRLLDIKTNNQFYYEALQYLYYYNNRRKHSSLNNQTPFETIKKQVPQIDDRIRIVPPIFLDKVSIDLGPWSGYHLLAQYRYYR